MKQEIPESIAQKLQVITELMPEIKRLQDKLQKAAKELNDDKQNYLNGGLYLSYHNDFAAAKRSALDVKKELTRLTQFTVKY